MRIIVLFAMLVSLFHVEVGHAKDRPQWGLCTPDQVQNNPHAIYKCTWNESDHTWSGQYVGSDAWESADSAISSQEAAKVSHLHDPFREPVEKTYSVYLVPFYRPPDHFVAMIALGALPYRKQQPRAVIINVEAGDWPQESRIWPHLGITYVGTVAKQEGYDVVLHDELIQGRRPLRELVRPGDIVGLSLVTSGIERGVALAHEAKSLGARYVIAGNDSAMFRARQLLELSGQPIDAVFTSNSLVSTRKFFQNADAIVAGTLQVADVATSPAQVGLITNEHRGVAAERKRYTADDFFLIPDLTLFGSDYWDQVHVTYRSQFGHKHRDPANVRNAIALLAQGCGRAGMGDICEYCTIRHVANVVLPPEGYLEQTLDTYRAHGINTFFNVTDSAFEMGRLALRLRKVGPLDTLVMYGRAQAIAQRPDLLDLWKSCVNERLLINCGMDSGSERILQLGINKSGSKVGSRLAENYQALTNIANAGPKVHLHFSVIFGSPGEDHESCLATINFVQTAIDTLGEQLDLVEGDVWWVNFGAPCSEIFTSYEAAQTRAALAGKTITRDEWQHYFARHANELVVPDESQEAWYTFFTNITIADARNYHARVNEMMRQVPGSTMAREFAFMPPRIT